MQPPQLPFRSLAAAILALVLWGMAGELGAEPGPARFRILTAEGRPIPFARISLFGTTGSVAADGEGRFTLAPVPRPPFRLTVFSAEGEWLGIVMVAAIDSSAAPQDLALALTERLEVTVRTGVAPSTLAPPAAGATVLGREERARRQAATVTELLEEVPGTTNVGQGLAAVPSVRGLARGRTLILLDDARITSERRAGPSATFLNPFSLESLEVVRGPGSVIYGSDALGGIIHGRTPVPSPGETGVRFEAGVGGGIPMSSTAAGVILPAGQGGLLLQGHQRSLDEYDSPEGEVADSGGRGLGFLAKWLLPTRRARWVLGLQLDRNRDVGKPREDVAGTATRYPEEDSVRLTANAVLPAPGRLESLELHLFTGRYSLATERQPTSGPGLDRSDVEASDASARLVATLPAGSGALRFGVDTSSRFDLGASTRSVDPNGASTLQEAIESADRLDAGLFLEGSLPVAAGRVTLSGGARGQGIWTRNEGGLTGDRSTSRATFTGYAAGSVELGAGWSATLQAARGFREPTLSDRYFSGVTGRGFIQGNADLLPEESLQYDLSIRRSGRRLRIAAYGYLYTIEDLIERYRTSPAPADPNAPASTFAFRNRGEAEIAGAELEADWELARGFALRLSYGQARGTETGGGQPLADVPPRRARLALGQRIGDRAWWRAELEHQWRDDRPGPAEAVTDGWSVVDLSAGVRIAPGVEVRVVGANLLDRVYPASADDDTVPAPGRSAAIFVAGELPARPSP